MGIQWFAPKAKQGVEVKVTKSSIVFTESGLQKLQTIDQRFTDATHVRLGWDGDRNLVAVAPAAETEKGHFKVGRRGRNQSSRTVNAAKFFEAFELTLDGVESAILQGEDGVAVFQLGTPAVAASSAPVRRRRGRAPKSAE
jgi:hypothetical protein